MLESDVEVGKKMYDTLVKQVASLERQCWRTTLYSRRECVEIIGILSSIVHSDLEKSVCKVLQHIRADICEEKIELFHSLGRE